MIIDCCSEIVDLFMTERETQLLYKVCIFFKTIFDSLISFTVAMEMEIQKTSIIKVSRD